jgi:hypothetical protein
MAALTLVIISAFQPGGSRKRAVGHTLASWRTVQKLNITSIYILLAKA